MNLTDLANLGQLVGSIAVVASLIFVGLQIRHSTKASRSSTLQMNADYWLTHIATLADTRFSAIYSKGALGREQLDSAEFRQFFLLCRITFIGLENQHYQYRTGLLDDDAYRGYEASIREQIAAFPGIRAMWQLVRHTYGTEFVKFLDEQIRQAPVLKHGAVHQRWRELVSAERRA